MPATYTPIRYPGGKSKLFPLVESIIEKNDLIDCTYAEAYCGGAGLAIRLLLSGRVSSIVLNDIDPAVFSMWDCIVNHSDDLCRFIESVPLNIDEWKRQKETFLSAEHPSADLGKAAFYLNRTNRSGILRGGPIGGMSQNGNYKIDARFNRRTLIGKVRAIAERSDDIRIWNEDAVDFVADALPGIDNLFANFDPPYVVKGPGLYENSYTDADHKAIAKMMSGCPFPWIVTYDDAPLIREAYKGFDMFSIKVGYSAARSKIGNEILIASPGIRIPDSLPRVAA